MTKQEDIVKTQRLFVLLAGIAGLAGFAVFAIAQPVPDEEDVILDPTGGKITVEVNGVIGRGAEMVLREDVATGKYEIQCGDDGAGHPITNYIGVPAIDEYTIRVGELGGEVVMPKTPVSGMGYFAVCLDTESNAFALWETDNNAE